MQPNSLSAAQCVRVALCPSCVGQWSWRGPHRAAFLAPGVSASLALLHRGSGDMSSCCRGSDFLTRQCTVGGKTKGKQCELGLAT